MTEHRRANMSEDPACSPTLPGWAYTDPALFEREKREIFYKSWQYAGWIGDLREPGNYLAAQILDQHVVILRGDDGVLRGFFNVCRHRAHTLLVGCGRTQSIVCPYHAWSYDIDGSLRSARGLESATDFDAAQFALRPVRVDLLADKLVFVNLDPAAKPLRHYTEGLEEELRDEIADFSILARVTRPDPADGRLPTSGAAINANWKIVIDNCLECYHCRSVHPAFRQLIDMDDFKVRAHAFWASLKGHPRNPSVIPDTARNKTYRFWWLWPNTFFEMSPGGAHGFTAGSQIPASVDRTVPGHSDRYGVPGAPLHEPRGYSDLQLVPEDRSTMESVQRNIGSLGYGEGRFSFDPQHGETSEEAVHRFQWLVAKAVGL